MIIPPGCWPRVPVLVKDTALSLRATLSTAVHTVRATSPEPVTTAAPPRRECARRSLDPIPPPNRKDETMQDTVDQAYSAAPRTMVGIIQDGRRTGSSGKLRSAPAASCRRVPLPSAPAVARAPAPEDLVSASTAQCHRSRCNAGPVHPCRGFGVAPVVRAVTGLYRSAWTKRATGLEVPRAGHPARPGGGRNGVIGGAGRRRGPDHIAGTTSRA